MLDLLGMALYGAAVLFMLVAAIALLWKDLEQ